MKDLISRDDHGTEMGSFSPPPPKEKPELPSALKLKISTLSKQALQVDPLTVKELQDLREGIRRLKVIDLFKYAGEGRGFFRELKTFIYLHLNGLKLLNVKMKEAAEMEELRSFQDAFLPDDKSTATTTRELKGDIIRNVVQKLPEWVGEDDALRLPPDLERLEGDLVRLELTAENGPTIRDLTHQFVEVLSTPNNTNWVNESRWILDRLLVETRKGEKQSAFGADEQTALAELLLAKIPLEKWPIFLDKLITASFADKNDLQVSLFKDLRTGQTALTSAEEINIQSGAFRTSEDLLDYARSACVYHTQMTLSAALGALINRQHAIV